MSILAVRVTCDYDFSGSFGGNNNEEVFTFSLGSSSAQIEDALCQMLTKVTGLSAEELEDLWDWNYITIQEIV